MSTYFQIVLYMAYCFSLSGWYVVALFNLSEALDQQQLCAFVNLHRPISG